MHLLVKSTTDGLFLLAQLSLSHSQRKCKLKAYVKLPSFNHKWKINQKGTFACKLYYTHIWQSFFSKNCDFVRKKGILPFSYPFHNRLKRFFTSSFLTKKFTVMILALK